MTDKIKIGVLTAFAGSDSAYSLVNVVQTQLSMLLKGGYSPVLFVSPSFQEQGFWQSSKFEIRKTVQPDATYDELLPILREKITDIDVMICHDIVFLAQHAEWARVVRQLAKEFPNITWLHWQHSRGDHVVEEPCENSYYCYPNQGDLGHVAAMNKTTVDKVVYVPHPIDLAYFGWPELAIQIAEDTGYPFADVSGILPSRLDRQKQIDKAVRLYAGLKRAGKSVCFICADAYATGDRFKEYKKDVLEISHKEGLTDNEFLFLGERYEECTYATPRPVVKALYEMGNLFVLPSNSETSSLVAMEAAIAGNLLVINTDFHPIHHLYKKALTLQFGSVFQDTKYYRTITTADGETTKILDDQLYWDDQARITVAPILDSQINLAVKRQQFRDRWPSQVFANYLDPLIKRVYRPHLNIITLSSKSTLPGMQGDPEVTAIICSLDNLPMLKRQLNVLSDEVGHTIVVNNGSRDGTKEWLEANPIDGVQVINRENEGAGKGRNAGLELWNNSTPYTLMIDGGILPPYKGVKAMKDYLLRHPEVYSISPEIATCYTTNEDEATLVFNQDEIKDEWCFQQQCLSGTAYGLYRADTWKVRFNEEGPFGEPGWGVDDNDMACRWRKEGIIHHDFTIASGIKLYRRASGSHDRLYEETGIYPTQYGSVYEKRVVKMYQEYPEYLNGIPEVSCVVLGWNEFPIIAKCVKKLHDELKDIVHEIIVVDNGSTDETKRWMDTYALRQHHGNVAIDAVTGEIIHRGEDNEDLWTGNFIAINLPQNMGSGHGFNTGFAKARGKYIFCISGDILISDGSVVALVNYLKEHDDVHYVGLNANICQGENEEVEFGGLVPHMQIGLGNYAYNYSVIKREVWDAGVRFAEEGPFEGPGCGYEEAEFANMMYSKGFRGYLFNSTEYYHQRRDGQRSGLGEKKESNYDERKMYLTTRWNKIHFGIINIEEQPPERHLRRIAVMNNNIMYPGNPGPAGFLTMAFKKIGCQVDQYASLEDISQLSYDNYIFVDDGDNKHWPCPEWAHPSKYWTVDMYNPSGFPYSPPEEYLAKLRTFDKVFCVSKSAVDFCLQNGLSAVHLPHAASEDYHKPYDNEKVWDWVAIWHNYGERENYTNAAQEKFPNGYLSDTTWGDDYPRYTSKARCVINKARGQEYNAKVVETMMIGVPLVTDRAKYLDMFFVENEHYRGHSSIEEMLEQIQWVKDHPVEAQDMARRARKLVLEKHRYYHRAINMFYEEFWDAVTYK